MKTPIYDFLCSYSESAPARLHMPGHKGRGALGVEKYDITEVDGADVLYSPSGIIEESEGYATELFATAHSFYSTEGSTLAIKAMLATAMKNRGAGCANKVLAGRNAHKAFLYAAALLDFEIAWLVPEGAEHIASAEITPDAVRAALSDMKELPFAVYITSPDYLGGISDIRGIADVCREYGIPLLCDNAHGAYLAFLEESLHPIAQGAAMCADSAHKTLPVLTGGAYLHIGQGYPQYLRDARAMLSLFASTSPSYLILATLDLCNARLASDYRDKLAKAVKDLTRVKSRLTELSFRPVGDEPLKLTLDAGAVGYLGTELAEYLKERGIIPEFYDRDYTVLMVSAETAPCELSLLLSTLEALPIKPPKPKVALKLNTPTPVLSIREAIFAPSEEISAEDSEGRILSSPSVSCPPAIPIAISGERLTKDSIKLFEYYGIEKISVVCE